MCYISRRHCCLCFLSFFLAENIALSALTLLVGGRKGIWPIKTEWWYARVVICLERAVNDLHIVQLMRLPPIIPCFIKIPNGSAFLVPAYQGYPGKKVVKLM